MPTRFVRPILSTAMVAALLVAAVTWTGCGGPPVGEEAVDPARDSLWSSVSDVNDAGFRSAFERLGSLAFTRYMRTEQFDGDDFMVAFRERVDRVGPGPSGPLVESISSDSAGEFQFGFFNRFVSESAPGADPVDMAPFVLEDEPAYARPRNREKYDIVQRPDTLLWDTQARVIEVVARPVVGDGENIRRVRYFMDRASGELLAIYVERIDLALLFREESSFYIHVRPGPGGGYVPYNTRFDTILKTPFRSDHRFRSVATYYEYAVP